MALALLGFFLASSLVAIALTLVVPFLALAVAIILAFTLHFILAGHVLGLAVRALETSISYCGSIADVLIHPQSADGELQGRAVQRVDAPQLWSMVDEVAARCKTRSVDRILVSLEVGCAAAERSRGWFRRRERVLCVGLPEIYVLTVDQLQAVLAHETMHLRGLDNFIAEQTQRWFFAIEELAVAHPNFWSPLYWSSRVCLFLVNSLYLGWSRRLELDADYGAARTVGSNHMQDALRATKDELPAFELSAAVVARGAERMRCGPDRPVEASYRMQLSMPTEDKRRLRARVEGNPLDILGRTHPPFAMRVANLRSVPSQPGRDGRRAIAALPELRQLEERMARSLFHGTPLPARVFVERLQTYFRGVNQPAEAYDPDRLELDWNA